MYYIWLALINLASISNLNFVYRATMQTSRQIVDYFKIFKVLDIKKLEKHGEVKLVQDKVLGRKVLAIDGAVSTQNYIVFQSAQAMKINPTLSFSQRYLYIVGELEAAKVFCFQLTLSVNTKNHKILYSTVHKSQKTNSQGILLMPLEMKSAKWSIIVIDLFQLCAKVTKCDETRLTFLLSAVQVRAHSRVKNVYLSDNLYDPSALPKQMEMLLRAGQNFYSKYNYVLVNSKGDIAPTQTKGIKPKQQQQQELKLLQHNQNRTVSLAQQKKKADIASGKQVRQTKSLKSIHNKHNKKVESKVAKEHSFEQEGGEEMPVSSIAPRPKTTVDVKLHGVEGNSLSVDGVTAVGCFVVHPGVFPVHHNIKCMSQHMSHPYKLVVGYEEGSVCVWDLVRQKPLLYLKTELVSIRQILARGEGEQEKIFMVGVDRARREVILIVNGSEVLFRQVSTYPIHELMLVEGGESGEERMVSYGFENIRLWRINSHNRIITGVGLFLGKMNRKVLYCSGCRLDADTIMVVDDSGYLTRVSLFSQKMQDMRKISENGLDRIINIPQRQAVIVAESSGCLRMLSYDLEVLEVFQLGDRVKSMSYVVERGDICLNLWNYNRSTASFNLTKSQYQYKSRQHTDSVIGLAYSAVLSKVVSISKDNTLRIWALSAASSPKSPLPYELKQQYEFLIGNGEIMTCVTVDRTVYAYVGFGSAVLRKVDISKFQIDEQKSLLFNDIAQTRSLKVSSISVSKNNRNVAVCVSEDGMGANSYVVLCNDRLQILHKYNPSAQFAGGKQTLRVLCGFSESHKKMFICWCYGAVNRLDLYSMTDKVDVIYQQLYVESTPVQIRHEQNMIKVEGVAAYGHSQMGVYEMYDQQSGCMVQSKLIGTQLHSVSGSVIASAGQQLKVSLMLGDVAQSSDLAEPMSNVIICPPHDSQGDRDRDISGFILLSGSLSHSIYIYGYEIRNIDQLKHTQPQIRKNQQSVCEDEELECVESKLVPFDQAGQQQINPSYKLDSKAKVIKPVQEDGIKGLYEDQQLLYNECKEYINPSPKQQQMQPKQESSLRQAGRQGKSGIELIYGWSTTYSQLSDRLVWFPSCQSVLLVSQRTLIMHFFKEPVEQKVVRLPVHPNIVCSVSKYIAVGMGNQIRLYSRALEYVRSYASLGESVQSVSVSNCGGFLLVASSSAKSSKTYLQVMDIVTCSTLCSTYRQLIEGRLRVECNPYQQCLQFLLVTSNSVSFYRLTSILTLQTQELEGLPTILKGTDAGGITCAKFAQLQQEEVVLVGMLDGSILVVDSRANSIILVCRKVCQQTIKAILLTPQQDASMLILVAQSNYVYAYQLEDYSLHSLVAALQNQPKVNLTTESEVTLYSDVEVLGGGRLGMLAMTKFGTLWLLDITGSDTIKILSVHSAEGHRPPRINKAIISQGSQLTAQMRVITGADDGTVKETSMMNLQQANEIYRPRKSVNDILIAQDLLIIAFDMEVCVYTMPAKQGRQQWLFFGSVNFLQAHGIPLGSTAHNVKIVSVLSYPVADYFVVCSSERLFMMQYHRQLSLQSGKLKLEIKEVGGGLETAQGAHVGGPTCLLVREASKISAWRLKQRRGSNQLGILDEVVFYLGDVYQVDASDAKFVPAQKTKGREYMMCHRHKPVIQWRDIEQHSIIRQIQINSNCPRALEQLTNGNLLVGDEEGILWQILPNGLTHHKIRVFDTAVRGILEVSTGKVVVYGSNLVLVAI